MPGSASASKPALFARLVKIEHSVYALPFAYAGAFLAADGMPTWAQLVWITVAMVGARSAAMSLNRLIDAELDARNPRTATRELPAGRLGRREVWLFTAVSVALLTYLLEKFAHRPPDYEHADLEAGGDQGDAVTAAAAGATGAPAVKAAVPEGTTAAGPAAKETPAAAGPSTAKPAAAAADKDAAAAADKGDAAKGDAPAPSAD